MADNDPNGPDPAQAVPNPAQAINVALPTPRRRRLRGGSADTPAAGGEIEEWMLTYMDLVTLLVVLFVLLLSIATFDPSKRKEMAEGLEAQSSGGFSKTVDATQPLPSNQIVLEPWRPTPPEVARELQGLGLPEGVRLAVLDDGVLVEIDNNVLFTSGSAALSAKGQEVLDRLVAPLGRGVFSISVEGHTDDVPIATPQFPSNWELSSARASVVVRHFVTRNLDQDRFRAIGYAATRPIDRTGSADGRARNRRVNLLLETGKDKRP